MNTLVFSHSLLQGVVQVSRNLPHYLWLFSWNHNFHNRLRFVFDGSDGWRLRDWSLTKAEGKSRSRRGLIRVWEYGLASFDRSVDELHDLVLSSSGLLLFKLLICILVDKLHQSFQQIAICNIHWLHIHSLFHPSGEATSPNPLVPQYYVVNHRSEVMPLFKGVENGILDDAFGIRHSVLLNQPHELWKDVPTFLECPDNKLPGSIHHLLRFDYGGLAGSESFNSC